MNDASRSGASRSNRLGADRSAILGPSLEISSSPDFTGRRVSTVSGRFSRKGVFVSLRFTFIIAAAYLVLAAKGFSSLPGPLSLLIIAALASNVVFMSLPRRFFNSPLFSASVVVIDMVGVTAALVLTGEFSAEFFFLYAAVLFLAAISENLKLIAIGALVGATAYLYFLTTQNQAPSLWSTPTLIRLPFLFMVAIFYGYLVDRLRAEQHRRSEESLAFAGLEQAQHDLQERADDLERAHSRLESEVRERAEAERSLEAANRRLEQMSQTKSDFISNVSHELRTPLTSIKNAVELMSSGKTGPLTDHQRRFLTIASHNTTRLGDLIDDLLDLSKIEAGRLEFLFREVELEQMLQTVLDSFDAQAADRSLDLVFRCADDLSPVWVDPKRVEQIVVNLMSNALKFTPAEGQVRLETRNVPNGVEIAVADTGVGLTDEAQQRIFERFYRVEDTLTRETQGTGLGLAIVRQLLAGHGSNISLSSKPGEGSRFSFVLPAKSSQTVEMLDFEREVQHYKTQAGFFSLLVFGVEPSTETQRDSGAAIGDVERVRDFLRSVLPRRSDQLVSQPISQRVLLSMLMTPRDGATLVKTRLQAKFVDGAEDLPTVTIHGPAMFPEDSLHGNELIAHAMRTDLKES